MKARGGDHLKNVDGDITNLMAYLIVNPAPSIYSNRISEISLKTQVEKIGRKQKRDERTILNEQSGRKKAMFLKR